MKRILSMKSGYKGISRFLIFLILAHASLAGLAQNVTIRGLAHRWYAGKVLRLQVPADYVTNLTRVENSDTVAPDGSFSLVFHADQPRPVMLSVENVVAEFYVEPAADYSITLPEPADKVDILKDVQHQVNPGIITADSAELNTLIFDFLRIYNGMFSPDNNRYLSRAVMFRLADSLRQVCDKRYAAVRNEYFRSYVAYSIASVNASVSRGEDYLVGKYILNKPVQYDHSEYMKFFNACFRGYLNAAASRKKGESLYRIINVEADYETLNAFLKEERFLKNDTIRELVIISNLWDFYFSADFVSDAVSSVVSKLNLATNIKQHKAITASMLAFFNKMQEGSAAPDFSARTRNGTMGSLGSLKGRWVYLNFFSTKNTESLKEMPKIAALNKKYGGKMVFLSICVDDSVDTYLKYLRSHPKFNWPIWYNYDPSIVQTARDKYFVTGSEAYYLINNAGYLAQSPALSPSRGIEYRFNIIFRIKEKTTKTGIR